MTKVISEFDKYVNLNIVTLNYQNNSSYCLDLQRYVKGARLEDQIDKLDGMIDQIEAIGSEAVVSYNLDTLPKVDEIESGLDSIIAKMELAIHFANWRLN